MILEVEKAYEFPLALIHPSAWKACAANFVITAFFDIRYTLPLASNQEVGYRTDEVHESRQGPQPLVAPDLFLRPPVDIHERRQKQPDLKRSAKHDTSLLTGTKVFPFFLRHDTNLSRCSGSRARQIFHGSTYRRLPHYTALAQRQTHPYVRVLTYDRVMARTPDGASVFYTPADAAGTPFFFERYFSTHLVAVILAKSTLVASLAPCSDSVER
jgi:hypothetical protein